MIDNRVILTTFASSSLLNMKQIQVDVDDTNLKLATGKKVNSALDDPVNFFGAKGLEERSSDLNTLLDGMSQAVQMIQAAETAMKGISSFISQAKGSAQKALSEGVANSKVESTVDISEVADIGNDIVGINDNDVFQIRTGKARELETSGIVKDKTDLVNDYASINDGDEFVIKTDEGDTTITINSGDSIFDIRDDIEAVSNLTTDFDNQGKLSIKTLDGSDISIDDTTGTAAKTIGFDTGVDITVDDGDSPSDLIDKLNAVDGIEAYIENDHINIEETNGKDIVITDTTGETAKVLQIDKGAKNGINNREEYSKEFEDLLSEIDTIAYDASYKGVNLIKGDNHVVNFNSKRTSSFELKGFDITKRNLGIKQSDGWETKRDILDSLVQLENAQRKVRNVSESFSLGLNTIKTRQDITESMIETLETGADKLVVGDLNEMGAEALSVQTRQKLATQSFQMTAGWVRGVLQMF